MRAGWLCSLCLVSAVAWSDPWPQQTLMTTPSQTDGTEFGPHGELLTVSEQDGTVILCFPPTGSQVVEWSCVTVFAGLVGAEHASMAHLGMGRYAIIAAGEGDYTATPSIPARLVMVIAPVDVQQWPDPQQWVAAEIPVSVGLKKWLTTCPIDLDQDGIDEIVVGSKSAGSVGQLKVDVTDPLNVALWQYYVMSPALSLSWIMSMEPFDANVDGWMDILFTDRKGKIGVLMNPGAVGQTALWAYQQIAGLGATAVVRFGDIADLDGDGDMDVAVAVSQGVRVFIRDEGAWNWSTNFYGLPAAMAGVQTKDTKILDVDGNGAMDLMVNSIHSANGSISGVAIIPFLPSVDVAFPNPSAYVLTPSIPANIKHDECKEIRLQYPQEGTSYQYGKQIVPDPNTPPDLVCTGELSNKGIWVLLNPLAGQVIGIAAPCP